MLTRITRWGGKATLSCSISTTPWLWQLLSYSLPTVHWHAAIQTTTGFISSLHAGNDNCGNVTYQQVLTTGYTGVLKETVIETNDSIPEMPLFNEEELYNMTVEDLKGICKKYNIKMGKAKASYVANIMKCSETLHGDMSKVLALQRSFQNTSLADPAPIHEFYRDNFNLVDLADRHWYSVEDRHHHHQWKTKMILAILCDAIMNLWVYASKMEYHSWLPWRITLAKTLMQL